VTGPVVILGGDGQLGCEFTKLLPDARVWTQNEFDLADPARTLVALQENNPQLVINCAAFTDVDACEYNPSLAMRVNSLGLYALAAWQRQSDCHVVHFSTDYVFDGSKREPYCENDIPRPINVYGISKRLSEYWLQGKSLIVRSSLLLSSTQNSFPAKVMAWASCRPEINVVADVVAAPTAVKDIARAVVQLINNERFGVVNITNYGACSRYELARSILGFAELKVRVNRARQVDFTQAAPRPPYSELSLRRLADWGIRMRPWREALAEIMEEIKTTTRAAG